MNHIRLIWNWRRAPRMFVVQGLAVIASIQSVLLIIPASKAMDIVPFTSSLTWTSLGFGLTIGTAVISALGRLIDQGKVTSPTVQEPIALVGNEISGAPPAVSETKPKEVSEMFNLETFKARIAAMSAVMPAIGQMIQLAEAVAPTAPGLKKADLVIQMLTAAEPEIASVGLNLASTISNMVTLFRAAGTLPQPAVQPVSVAPVAVVPSALPG